MMVSFAGCSKNNNKSDEIGYIVETTTDSDLYTHVINTRGFYSDKYNFGESINCVEFAKVIETEEYDSRKIINDKTDAFYRENLKLVWPDCYNTFDSTYWTKQNSFDMSIKSEKIKTTGDSEYIVINSSMTAKRNLDNGINLYRDGQKQIKKGDNFSSTAIYYNNELVAYKQTGAGSECANVKQATIGDVDKALSTIKEAGILSETKEISAQDLYNKEDELSNAEINTDSKKTILH